MKRAQSEDMKIERKRSILEASRFLVTERGLDGFRLDDVATALSLVKGTLYRYFPTRQDLLAELLKEEMEQWWIDMGRDGFSGVSPGAWFTQKLANRTILVRLLTDLHRGIESGLCPEGLLALKLWFADFLGRASREIERLFPVLAGRGSRFLLDIYAMLIGVAQLANPPAVVAALIGENEALSIFRINLPEFLEEAINLLFAGYLEKTDKPVPSGDRPS